MMEFIAMGGYGWYIWGAYDLTFLLLFVEIFLLWKRSKKREAQA